MLLIYCLLFAQPSFGQYKICKEYYCAQQDSYKKNLRFIRYYDEHHNIIRKVSISGDGIAGYDTTDYFYKNNLLVKELCYHAAPPESRPPDTVLNYIKKHPETLGHSLHNIIKLHVSDTEMTNYYYNARGLLIRKENARLNDADQMQDGYKKKLADVNITNAPDLRTWQHHRITNYIYDKNNLLIESNGDLYDKTFGYDSEYGASARKFFYNSKKEIVLDSIVSYTGTKFDGIVSNYTHFPNRYEIKMVEYGDFEPKYSNLVIILNNEGKVLEESSYDDKPGETIIGDARTTFREKQTYEYNSSGMLIKKSTFYSNTLNPANITYYTYE